MSVATELTRIQTAKADIKASIEAKGVTVPSSALIDEYADYVDEISGGGGGQAEQDLKNLIERDITSITIPNGVTNIGNSAFYNCISLTSVTIPSSVTTIDYSAFYGCSRLTSVTIPNSVTNIGNLAFNGCNSLPTESYLRYADKWAVLLTSNNQSSYALRADTVGISERLFYNCSGITSIGTVGSGASIELPNTLKYICNNCFDTCRYITSLTIPNSVISIGENCFKGCYNISSLTLGSGLTNIGRTAFNGCTSLTSVTIPSSVTTIGDGAFYGCTGITSVTFENGVTTVSVEMFRGCTSLASVIIPSSVTTINGGAFQGCTNLTSVTIPSSVTTIDYNAFNGCSTLASVTVEATTPPTLGSNVFESNASGRKIYVPAESVETYKTAWTRYAADIETIPNP